MIELSKKQKKIFRQLIDLAIQRECKSFTDKIAKFLNSSKGQSEDSHELYIALYKKVASFDKHLGKRYDDLSSSSYFFAVFGLFHDKILTMEDIACYDIEDQDELLKLKELYDTVVLGKE
jgi:hypothetical protein